MSVLRLAVPRAYEVLALNETTNNWRRLESRSLEALIRFAVEILGQLVLLAVVVYCAVSSAPLALSGGAIVALVTWTRRQAR
jgi:hypothetical protein